MSSLNTSSNGVSISASYQKIVNTPLPTGPAANSPTYAQWAVFSVQAPLANAFQPDPSKESVLKVQSTGEGELIDLLVRRGRPREDQGLLHQPHERRLQAAPWIPRTDHCPL